LVPEKRKMQATFTLGQSLPPAMDGANSLHQQLGKLVSILQQAWTHAIFTA
jgi:hypothetical protein